MPCSPDYLLPRRHWNTPKVFRPTSASHCLAPPALAPSHRHPNTLITLSLSYAAAADRHTHTYTCRHCVQRRYNPLPRDDCSKFSGEHRFIYSYGHLADMRLRLLCPSHPLPLALYFCRFRTHVYSLFRHQPVVSSICPSIWHLFVYMTVHLQALFCQPSRAAVCAPTYFICFCALIIINADDLVLRL